jgi:hypothetical protein
MYHDGIGTGTATIQTLIVGRNITGVSSFA